MQCATAKARLLLNECLSVMAVLKYIIISLLFLLVYDLLPCVVTEEILPNVQYDLMDAKIWTWLV